MGSRLTNEHKKLIAAFVRDDVINLNYMLENSNCLAEAWENGEISGKEIEDFVLSYKESSLD